MDYAARLTRLRAALAHDKLDALLVTHLPNVRYLCGFTGSNGILAVTADRAAFFTDGRYITQAHEQVKGAETLIPKKPALPEAVAWLRRRRARRIGLEADRLSANARTAIAKGQERAFRNTSGVVERLRMVKEPNEIEQIRKAVLLGASLFEVAVKTIRPGVTEAEVAAEMEYQARRLGAEGMAFDTIVAAGLRSALPHGRASQHAIPAKGFVVLDFGVILAGYHSDMTRTVHVGQPDRKALRQYRAVQEAQLAGVAAVRQGSTAEQIDRATRRILTKARLERYFTHSTGHGVGLEIHEPPRLGKGQKEPLLPGMVITIEPGAYVPGQGGVRIEDIVVVRERGCEVLTPTPKDLFVL
jgi:Xaa-Pro aminopeptidase